MVFNLLTYLLFEFISIPYDFDMNETCRSAGYLKLSLEQHNYIYPKKILCDPGSVNVFPAWINIIPMVGLFLSTIVIVKMINGNTAK